MESPLYPGELVMGDDYDPNMDALARRTVDGEVKAMGLKPRDFARYPVGYTVYARPFDLPLIPESEWQDRLDEQIKAKAQLSNLRDVSGPGGQPIPSRDQNGRGYCLPAGVPVLMSDGTTKPIEQVVLGDRVVTNIEKQRRVLQTHRRLFTGELITVRADGLAPVEMTADHLLPTPDPEGVGFFDAPARAFKPGETVYGLTGREPGKGGANYSLRKVVDVTRREVYDFPVYDIGVEEHHYFVAGDGLLSHNCWAHSTVSAALLARAKANEPYADLSAYAIACIIKRFRDEGGWNAESVQFLAERGCPTSEFWPQRSMDRANDNERTWANAKEHVALEWMDLDPRQMWPQLVTALLSGFSLAGDFNWWGHSVGIADLVALSPRKIRIWNSWGDSWSANGMGVLEGSKALPDAAIALRVVRASQV